MGLSGALFGGVRDPRFGRIVTQDLASHHVAQMLACPAMEAVWLEEADSLANDPAGALR